MKKYVIYCITSGGVWVIYYIEKVVSQSFSIDMGGIPIKLNGMLAGRLLDMVLKLYNYNHFKTI